MTQVYCVNDLHVDTYLNSPNSFRMERYKKFLSEHTLPADILAIAGDISGDIMGAVNLLCAAATMFERVIWIPGNGECRCIKDAEGMNTVTKLLRIEKFCKTKSKAGRIVKLDGTTVSSNGRTFCGTVGMVDETWYKEHSDDSAMDVQSAWENSPNKYWNIVGNQFKEISSCELGRVRSMRGADADFVMTHYAPSNLIDIGQFRKVNDCFDKRFLAFDATDLTDNIKDGAVYHYGHMHVKDKRIVRNSKGEFLLINNSLGRKKEEVDNPKKLTKQDFLLTI